MIVVRSAVFNVAFYTLFVIMMILGLPTMLLPRGAVLWVVRFWARSSLWLLATICGARLEVRDRALLPAGACILAVKHQSFLETFALLTLIDDFAYVLKRELLAIPLFGWYLKATGQIAIDRAKGGGALLMLQRAVRARLGGQEPDRDLSGGHPPPDRARRRLTSPASRRSTSRAALPARRSRSTRACSGLARAGCATPAPSSSRCCRPSSPASTGACSCKLSRMRSSLPPTRLSPRRSARFTGMAAATTRRCPAAPTNSVRSALPPPELHLQSLTWLRFVLCLF